MSRTETLHATAVAIDGRGVMLLGPPGSGKSDLALRLIDRGGLLIADDQTVLALQAGQIILSHTGILQGQLEVRGVGILEMPSIGAAPLSLVIQCDDAPERLPEPEHQSWLGVLIPVLRLSLNEASAPIKLERALSAVVDGALSTFKERAFR